MMIKRPSGIHHALRERLRILEASVCRCLLFFKLYGNFSILIGVGCTYYLEMVPLQFLVFYIIAEPIVFLLVKGKIITN